jgi:hypothetical protein
MLDCDCEREKDQNCYVDTTCESLTDDIDCLWNNNDIYVWIAGYMNLLSSIHS